MNWYLKCWHHYADFRGRARRKEYWLFVLWNAIIVMILSIIDVLTGTYSIRTGAGLLSGIYSLAIFIPGLAVCVRRLHDIGKSGWYYLVCLIPIIGWILLIVWYCTDSEYNVNEWGTNPKIEQ